MKKFTIVLLFTLTMFVSLNFNSVSASEQSDYYYQSVNEYYASVYGFSTYFYEETVYYRPPWVDRNFNYPERYKKALIYQHQSSTGVVSIVDWESEQITPWVDFVLGASINSSQGFAITYTSSWSVTGGIEVAVLKEIVKLAGSVTYEKSYSETYHQEHGIVASYQFALSVLGTSSGYTDYAIVHQQALGGYKTFNYEGETPTWYYTTFNSASSAISEWEYTGLGYFTAPLDGLTYTKYSVIGTIIY